jgi:N utilization substance protein B
MGARSGGRAIALQVFFALDADGSLDEGARDRVDVDAVLAKYWRSFEDAEAQEGPVDPEARVFADEIVREAVDKIVEIDEAVRKSSKNWRLERMPRVDRNVLRLGTLELLRHRETPRAVAIDEAVELAKRFGGEESTKFVNGVLERVADEAGRVEARRSTPPSGPDSRGGRGGGRGR